MGFSTRTDWSGWIDAATPGEALHKFLADVPPIVDTTGHGVEYRVRILPERKLQEHFGDDWR